jgi:hypothetical protein
MNAPKLFDLSKPDAEAIPSSFGGGWIVPLTPAGTQALMEFFGEEPTDIAPIARRGYIVEPYQSGDLAEHLHNCNCAWKVN